MSLSFGDKNNYRKCAVRLAVTARVKVFQVPEIAEKPCGH